MSEIRKLQNEICDWADSVFPERTIQSAALKLYEEIGELLRNPHDPEEHADIYILMFDLSRMYGLTDIGDAVRKKMTKNRSRYWVGTAIGTMHHDPSKSDRSAKTSWAYQQGIEDFLKGRPCKPELYVDPYGEWYTQGYNNANGENEGSDND